MRVDILTLILLLTISCNSRSLEEKERVTADSLAHVKMLEDSLAFSAAQETLKKETHIKDSITKIEEMKVIGEINFGMKKSEVTRKWEKFENESKVPDKFLKGFYDYYIGNYEFFTRYDSYYENGLYRLQILGGSCNWEDYDTCIPKSFNAIKDVISGKYGEPQYLMPVPERHELSKGLNSLASWVIGKKGIYLAINDGATYYRVDVIIIESEVAEKIRIETAKKESENTKKSKDAF